MSGSIRPNPPSVNAWNAAALEAEYRRFKDDPASVAPDMAAFLQGFELGLSRPGAGVGGVEGGGETPEPAGSAFQGAAEDLIAAYRALGHLIARIDPFGRARTRPRALTIEHFGLTQADLDKPVHTGMQDAPPPGQTGGGGGAVSAPTLRQVIAHLEQSYCGPIGVEFMHIPTDQERDWFRRRFEGDLRPQPLSKADQVRVLEQMTGVERFEFFLGKRFQGKKRFSIEGGESVIPLLKFMTERAGEQGAQEIILGMAHRGRLAVLRHYLGKDLAKLFTEFKDTWVEGLHPGGGDVKYHRGYSGDQVLPDGRAVHLSLLNNPSHLESQDAVVMGRTRAKQDLAADKERSKVLSLLIHGDGALPGQGVVAECLNMARLEGYEVGGTLHVVINNLVGFTTDPDDSRSTEYCTDIAKIVNAPVLHVNGDDPEAVVRAARLAVDYRNDFHKDVFVDLVCFRRYGHNEVDEPGYTQPLLYALVREHPGTPAVYQRRLVNSGVVTQAQIDAIAEKEMAELDAAYEAAAKRPVDPVPPPGGGMWRGLTGRYSFDSPKTAVDPKIIAEVCAAMGRVPAGFNLHPKLKGLLQARASLPTHARLAHADAEQIAIGTLLLDGVPSRLSGQDSRRGTFTQRHAVLRDEKTGEKYTSLNHIRPSQKARFDAWDSPLSEYSVMGFDYGYSRANPGTLVMWEGQFGDFANGSQIMIDQYLASSEVKWNRWAGLVLLLPHGHEGQGPEHSSARLERFLQLCADENMEVVYPSTAAQMFHVLRRQALRDFRKPLIIMTPKKYLRIETAGVQELSTGAFRHVIDDPAHTAGGSAKSVTRVLYCTGKVYHELAERRGASGVTDAALVRIEQLYPFHAEAVRAVDQRYPRSARRVWVQEEPRNQGAFLFAADRFRQELAIELDYNGRPACASPATASERAHIEQQNRILTEAVGPAETAPTGPSNGSHSKKGATEPTSTATSKASRTKA